MSIASLTGRSWIGGERANHRGGGLAATEAASGRPLEPAYEEATPADLDRAIRAARDASAHFGSIGGKARAALLRRIAEGLEAAVDPIIARAGLETALPEGRLRGEMGRTTGQLRLFAGLIEEGSWVDARIDRPDPSRTPAPKPDVRSMLRPLGPVAVFGASNFPLAFSVAGGDTASALAAGCPVVVKAHPGHPGTAELVGDVIAKALADLGLPAGVFSLVFGGKEAGVGLVTHPGIAAVGFTGSRVAGRALMDAAAARATPIPVYAEMGSVNPVFLLPVKLASGPADLAAAIHKSVTLGNGQFCTCPGLVFVPAGPAGDEFEATLGTLLNGSPEGPMLTPAIREGYRAGVDRLDGSTGVTVNRSSKNGHGAALIATEMATFLANPELLEEIFGPAVVVVRCPSAASFPEVAARLDGQLTATVFAEPAELIEHAGLVDLLADRAGRLVFNGVPTGVEVGPAMVHGGPYPATGDGRSTSVGTRAILRFARPVCYQDWPDAALPEELREANPLGIRRLVDGKA